MNETEYVIVIKEGLFWIAKEHLVPMSMVSNLGEFVSEVVSEDVKQELLKTHIMYEIDTTLEHNGFEYQIDAWSYLVHLQDKEIEIGR